MKKAVWCLVILALPLASFGAVSFSNLSSLSAGTNPRGLATADLFGDGNKEVLVANFGSSAAIGQQAVSPTSSIQIFAHSDQGFKLLQSLAAGNSPRSLVVIDVNGDGRPDILATLYGENKVAVYLQNADHSFAAPIKKDTGAQPVGLAARVFAGVTLVAVSNYGSNNISLFTASPDQILTPVSGAPLDTHSSSPTDVAFVNVHDKPYVLSANFSGNNLSLLPIPGTASSNDNFQLLTINGASAPSKLAVGDVNKDGREDVVVAMFGNTPSGKSQAGQVAIFNQAVDGFSQAPTLVTLSGTGPNGISLGSLAGQAAIFAADRDSDLVDVLMPQNGAWSVAYSLSVSPTAAGSREVFQGPVDVACADLGGGHLALISSYNRSAGFLNYFDITGAGAPNEGSYSIASLGQRAENFKIKLPDGKTFIAFPNPAQDHTIAAFNLEQSCKVRLMLIDINGGVLAHLDLGELPSGVQSTDLNLSNYSSGIYSLVLQTDEGFGYGVKASFKLAIKK